MKEAILAFLIALVIGAGINQYIAASPPAPAPESSSPTPPVDGASQTTTTTVDTPGNNEQVDLSNVLPTSDATFDDDVLKASMPVLVDFYGDSCPPCKAMTPVIAKMADKYAGKVKFVRLDVNANPQITEKYNVKHIPEFIIFAKGERGESYEGIVPKETLAFSLDKTLR